MANKLSFFPMYASVFLNDRNVRRMDCAARGLYITLLCECWINGGLPDDPVDVATIIGRPEDEVKKSWAAVSSILVKRDDGLLYSTRLEEERERALDICDKRSASATEMHRRRKARADVEHYASDANAQQVQSKSSDNTIQDKTIQDRTGSSLRSEPNEPPAATPGKEAGAGRKWVPNSPFDATPPLPEAIPEDPAKLREYARWFMAEYGNIRDEKKQARGAAPWCGALDALRIRGANTREAARLFVRARRMNGEAPLFGGMCKSVPPMLEKRATASGTGRSSDSRATTVPPDMVRARRPSLEAAEAALSPEEREAVDEQARQRAAR